MTESPDIYPCVFSSYVRKCEIQNKQNKHYNVVQLRSVPPSTAIELLQPI